MLLLHAEHGSQTLILTHLSGPSIHTYTALRPELDYNRNFLLLNSYIGVTEQDHKKVINLA